MKFYLAPKGFDFECSKAIGFFGFGWFKPQFIHNNSYYSIRFYFCKLVFWTMNGLPE